MTCINLINYWFWLENDEPKKLSHRQKQRASRRIKKKEERKLTKKEKKKGIKKNNNVESKCLINFYKFKIRKFIIILFSKYNILFYNLIDLGNFFTYEYAGSLFDFENLFLKLYLYIWKWNQIILYYN